MRTLKAVLADDEYWTRETIKSLGHWDILGISLVGEASDGVYCQEMINQLKPDIVITDVKMPRMSGLDLAEELQKSNSSTRIIIVSGYGEYGLVHRALKAGVYDYLLKPVKEDELNRQLLSLSTLIRERDASIGEAKPIASIGSEELIKSASLIIPSISLATETGNMAALSKAFDDLKDVVKGHEGVHEQIAIYSLLSEKLLSINRSWKEKISGLEENGNPRYVFGDGGTIADVLDICEKAFLSTATLIDKELRGSKKFDLAGIKLFVESHFLDKGITLESVAASFGLSKEYLSRSFKSEYGILFSEYIITLRMEKAKECIIFEEVPLKEVGPLVGYDDPANFYRAFKKFYGITPGEMLAKAKNDNQSSQ